MNEKERAKKLLDDSAEVIPDSDSWKALGTDDAATRWRKAYAGADTPSLYALPEDDIAEQVTFKVDMRLLDSIPSLHETIAMSARDPLSTVLHYDVYVRVVLAYLSGLRMCL